MFGCYSFPDVFWFIYLFIFSCEFWLIIPCDLWPATTTKLSDTEWHTFQQLNTIVAMVELFFKLFSGYHQCGPTSFIIVFFFFFQSYTLKDFLSCDCKLELSGTKSLAVLKCTSCPSSMATTACDQAEAKWTSALCTDVKEKLHIDSSTNSFTSSDFWYFSSRSSPPD